MAVRYVYVKTRGNPRPFILLHAALYMDSAFAVFTGEEPLPACFEEASIKKGLPDDLQSCGFNIIRINFDLEHPGITVAVLINHDAVRKHVHYGCAIAAWVLYYVTCFVRKWCTHFLPSPFDVGSPESGLFSPYHCFAANRLARHETNQLTSLMEKYLAWARHRCVRHRLAYARNFTINKKNVPGAGEIRNRNCSGSHPLCTGYRTTAADFSYAFRDCQQENEMITFGKNA